MLQIGRSLLRSQLVSVVLFIDIKSFRSHYGPGVDSAYNRNEYREYFLGGKGGRCVRLTTLPPSCAVVTKSGSLNFLEPSGPIQACNGPALPFLSDPHSFFSVKTSPNSRDLLDTQRSHKLFFQSLSYKLCLWNFFFPPILKHVTTWLMHTEIVPTNHCAIIAQQNNMVHQFSFSSNRLISYFSTGWRRQGLTR